MLAVNLRGVFLCAKYALPAPDREPGAGPSSTSPPPSAWSAPPTRRPTPRPKAGVIALTQQLAVDLGPRGIRVNAVAPGYVDNDMADRRSRMTPDAAAANLAAREAAAALQPLGRQAATEEIAAAVAFLASDDASFMTGAIVPVDGGCTATSIRAAGRRLSRQQTCATAPHGRTWDEARLHRSRSAITVDIYGRLFAWTRRRSICRESPTWRSKEVAVQTGRPRRSLSATLSPHISRGAERPLPRTIGIVSSGRVRAADLEDWLNENWSRDW